MKARMIIEKWSDQLILDVTQEEYDEFQKMDLWDREAFLEEKTNMSYSYDVVEATLSKCKEEVE